MLLKRFKIFSAFLAVGIFGPIFFSTAPLSAAVPSTFTYQGSLKQNGAPVNGTYQMEFRLTNQSGSEVYWTSGIQNVAVLEGLYRIDLNPSNVDWKNKDPYIETKIAGATLLPREKMSSTAYALVSKSVMDDAINSSSIVNGSIKSEDMDVASFQPAGVGFVPPGALLMFLTPCPTGYSEVTDLAGRYPIGRNNAAGTAIPTTIGTSTGTLFHQHNVETTIKYLDSYDGFSSNGWIPVKDNKIIAVTHVNGSPVSGVGVRGRTFDVRFGSNDDKKTAQTTMLPPSLTVTFCKKN